MSTQRAGRGDGFFGQMRKLQIIRQDSQWLGGVCAGIAQRFNIDVVLVRGIAVALSVLGGLGLVIYGLCWALLPDGKDQIHFEQALAKNWTSGMTGSVIFLAVGIFPAPWFLNTVAPVLWPLVIVAAIFFLIFSRRNTKFDTPRSARPTNNPPAHAPAQGFDAAGTAATDADLTVHGTTVEKNWRADQQSFSARASAPQGASPTAPPVNDTTEAPEFEDHAMTSEHPQPENSSSTGSFLPPKDPHFTEPTDSFHYSAYAQAAQAKADRKARVAPPLPGWVATTVVGLTILVIAVVLSLDYLNILDLPGHGWGVALAAGLLVVGLCLVLAAAAKRTSGGLLGLAIPLLVFTLIFGNNLLGSSNDAIDAGVDSGRSYSAVFSNSTVDLSDMGNITEDTTVDLSSVFSKVDLKLPENVNVRVESNGVFISDLDGELPQNQRQLPSGTPTLTVDVTGVFSSVDTSVASPSF
ncbi:PspC domain-containing protein [Glutamicibacter sp.]|uniref:PspC domain-containing protein n=1 Tax=Glutamicibacter sp. TaxID=1931995 RepID=UPI0028BD6BCC|nr:PspC domain-containing protein [Glutamicibacter sp.]